MRKIALDDWPASTQYAPGSINPTVAAKLGTAGPEIVASRPASGSQTQAQSGDRLLRLSELTARLGISRSTVYRYVAAGRFPAPIQLSTRCIVWKASAIEGWMAGLAPTSAAQSGTRQ